MRFLQAWYEIKVVNFIMSLSLLSGVKHLDLQNETTNAEGDQICDHITP